MKPDLRSPGVSRRTVFSTLPALALAAGSPLSASAAGPTAPDPLPSWNDGAAKRAIFDFIRRTTDKASRDFVPPVDRIATFDQDGTLWVEHPLYTQAIFALDRVRILAAQHPQWRNEEHFKTGLANDPAALGRFSEGDWAKIIFMTHSGMTQQAFLELARQ